MRNDQFRIFSQLPLLPLFEITSKHRTKNQMDLQSIQILIIKNFR